MVMKSKKMRINKKNRRKSRKIQRGGGNLLNEVNELLGPLKKTLLEIDTNILRSVKKEKGKRQELQTEIIALQGVNNGNTIEKLIDTVTEAEEKAEQEKTALQQDKEVSEKALKERITLLETAVAEKEASLKEAKEKFETSKATNVRISSELKSNADDAICTIDKSHAEDTNDHKYFLDPYYTWGDKNRERRMYDLKKIQTLNLLFKQIVNNSGCNTKKSNKPPRKLGFNIVNDDKNTETGRCNFALPLYIKLNTKIEDFYKTNGLYANGQVDMGPPSSTFSVGDIYNIYDSSKYENINTIPVMSSVAYLTPLMRSGEAADVKKYRDKVGDNVGDKVGDIISNPLSKYIEDNKNMNFMTQDIVYVYQSTNRDNKHIYRAAVVLTKLMNDKKGRKLMTKLDSVERSNPCQKNIEEEDEMMGGNRKGSRNTKRRKRGGGLFSRNSRKGQNIIRKRFYKIINTPIFNKRIPESKPDDNYLIRYLDKSWGKLENKKYIVCRKDMVWIGWGDGSNLTRKWLIRDIYFLLVGVATGEIGIIVVLMSGAWAALITFAKTLLAGTFAMGLAATAPISVPLAAGAGLTALLLFKNKLPNKKILYAKIPLMKNVLDEPNGNIYLNDKRFGKLKSGRGLDPKVCVNAIEVLTCEEKDLNVSWSEQRNMRKRRTGKEKRDQFNNRIAKIGMAGGKKQKNTKKRRRKRNH